MSLIISPNAQRREPVFFDKLQKLYELDRHQVYKNIRVSRKSGKFDSIVLKSSWTKNVVIINYDVHDGCYCDIQFMDRSPIRQTLRDGESLNLDKTLHIHTRNDLSEFAVDVHYFLTRTSSYRKDLLVNGKIKLSNEQSIVVRLIKEIVVTPRHAPKPRDMQISVATAPSGDIELVTVPASRITKRSLISKGQFMIEHMETGNYVFMNDQEYHENFESVEQATLF